MTIPELLEREMKSRNDMSERNLAERLGVSVNSVNAWHRGLRTPDPAYCTLIANFFGLPVDQVMEIAGHRPPVSEPGEEPEVPAEVMAILRALRDDSERLEMWVDIGKTLAERRRKQEGKS